MARSPRLPPPELFDLSVCRTCGAWDLAPETTHNGYCAGRVDVGQVEHVIAEPVKVEPDVLDRG